MDDGQTDGRRELLYVFSPPVMSLNTRDIPISELACVGQEGRETVVPVELNYDGLGLTEQLWCYWALEAESLSWGS